MIYYFEQKRKTLLYRIFSLFISFSFIFSLILPSGYAQGISTLNLSTPGTMVPLSQGFVPVLLKGMTIYPDNPLRFDFIIDSGEGSFSPNEIKNESKKLVKYFLAALTVPKDDLWVNLSPYEKNRIIPEELGKTELGRDLLALDYVLKQVTASLMYPEEESGNKFWEKIYKKAQEEYGTTEIPVNTFNKVWILPEEATVYEHENTVYVISSKLKVMLDSDYRALQNGVDLANTVESTKDVQKLGENIVREIILPAIEKEINEGAHFANLRQIYHSLILGKWYKETIKNSLLSKVYTDQNKILGINLEDETIKDKIYDRYIQSYKKGVFNYIKEDYDRLSKEIIPRKYFSGGIDRLTDFSMIKLNTIADPEKIVSSSIGDNFRLQIKIDPKMKKRTSSPVEIESLENSLQQRFLNPQKIIVDEAHVLEALDDSDKSHLENAKKNLTYLSQLIKKEDALEVKGRLETARKLKEEVVPTYELKGYVDFHVHSFRSDGQYSPTYVVYDAWRKGMEKIALVDHNSFEHFEEALKAGQIFGIEVIPAVEFDVAFQYTHKKEKYESEYTHVLGYFPYSGNGEDADIEAWVSGLKKTEIYTEATKRVLWNNIKQEMIRQRFNDSEKVKREGKEISFQEYWVAYGGQDFPNWTQIGKVLTDKYGKNISSDDVKEYLHGKKEKKDASGNIIQKSSPNPVNFDGKKVATPDAIKIATILDSTTKTYGKDLKSLLTSLQELKRNAKYASLYTILAHPIEDRTVGKTVKVGEESYKDAYKKYKEGKSTKKEQEVLFDTSVQHVQSILEQFSIDGLEIYSAKQPLELIRKYEDLLTHLDLLTHFKKINRPLKMTLGSDNHYNNEEGGGLSIGVGRISEEFPDGNLVEAQSRFRKLASSSISKEEAEILFYKKLEKLAKEIGVEESAFEYNFSIYKKIMALKGNFEIKVKRRGYAIGIPMYLGAGYDSSDTGMKFQFDDGAVEDRVISTWGSISDIVEIEIVSSSPTIDNKVGGIDLNKISVSRKGDGVDITFDPIQVQRILQQGVDGFAPVIINLIPINSILPLLGLKNTNCPDNENGNVDCTNRNQAAIKPEKVLL